MKTAVVLMNLGGPDSLDGVKPFLFNLFSDRAILDLPQPFRFLLARLICARRKDEACKIYQSIGGASPLLSNTVQQKEALEKALSKILPDHEAKAFICMRYWHPLTEEALALVQEFNPDQIVLLPLYPQFSTATTQSSFDAWESQAAKRGFHKPTYKVCCYPTLSGFIEQNILHIKEALAEVDLSSARLLFSAHGLPQRMVDGGDPYENQVRSSVQAIVSQLGLAPEQWEICFQSRVGPLKWLEPSTKAAIERSAEQKMGIVLVPISFVSEHSETLYELDQAYKQLAFSLNVPFFKRVQTVQSGSLFIDALAQAVTHAIHQAMPVFCPSGKAACISWKKCLQTK